MSEKIEFEPTPIEGVLVPAELRRMIDFASNPSARVGKFNEHQADGTYLTVLVGDGADLEMKSALPLPFALDASRGNKAEMEFLLAGLRRLLRDLESRGFSGS